LVNLQREGGSSFGGRDDGRLTHAPRGPVDRRALQSADALKWIEAVAEFDAR
jgi:hypothetical protein